MRQTTTMDRPAKPSTTRLVQEKRQDDDREAFGTDDDDLTDDELDELEGDEIEDEGEDDDA